MKVKRVLAVLIFSVCLCALSAASADTKIYSFSVDQIPQRLIQTAINVPAQDVSVRLTFAGDCTLGCEAKFYDYGNTAITKINENGFDYPFKLWQFLFAKDDATLINFEGVLTDNDRLLRAKKVYVFRGPTTFAQILPTGSVEMATIENNHILDLGEKGMADTIDALTGQNVHYTSSDHVIVLEKDGVRIGFSSSQFQLTPTRKRSINAQLEALKKVGCVAIVHNAHMGEEYSKTINKYQKEVADYVRERGATLLIGHHPHVVQGVWQYDTMLAVYSLGNFSFGGNAHPRDFDAVVADVTMNFRDGALTDQQLTLWPAEISGSTKRNDFQPYPATGELAQRVMRKMQRSSNYELSPYVEGQGAVQPVFVFPEATPVPTEEP